MVDSHLGPYKSAALSSRIASTAEKESLSIQATHVKYGTLDPLASTSLNSGAISTPAVSIVTIEHLILDCSALSYVDLSGTKVLTSLHTDLLNDRGVTLILANCSEPLIKQLDRCNYFQTFPKAQVYPSIIDAVMTIESSNQFAFNNSLNSPIVP